MATYLEIYNAADVADFQARCRVATWNAARDILAEATNTPNHAARLDWAQRVIEERTNISSRQLAVQVLQNATIAANPGAAPDGDIQFQVNSIIAQLVKVG